MKFGLQFKLLVPTIAAVFLCMGLASYFSYYKASHELWNGLVNSSQNIAGSVSKGMSIYAKDVESITSTQSRDAHILPMFTEQNPSEEAKQAAIKALSELTSFDVSIQAANLIDKTGTIFLSTEVAPGTIKPLATGNFADREYFQRAMRGEMNISEPLLSRTSGRPAFIVAAPVKSGDKVVGVISARVDLGKFTQEMILPVKIGQSGYAYMVDKSGLVFSHPEKDLILKYDIAKEDWGRKILSQDKGVVDYDFQGSSKSAIFVKDTTTGWTVVVTVNSADIAKSSGAVRNSTLIFGGAGILLVSLILFLIVRNMTAALSSIVGFASAVAAGDLKKTLAVSRQDELGSLSQALTTMVAKLKEMIDVSNEKTTEAQVQTDLARQATAQAHEARLMAETGKREGLQQAAQQLEQVVSVVTSTSEDLSTQIKHSSQGAEDLAQRMAETATSMEEMNATVLEVAQNASSAAGITDQARLKAQDGAGGVGRLVASIAKVQRHAEGLKGDMNALGQQAHDIGRIMNVINDIADQTNLLALNAAIEAARAGDAGRGFAVVADEVRKLAEKTMQATKEVGDAIQGIQQGTQLNVNNVEEAGKTIREATDLANASGSALQEIVDMVEHASDQVRSIATAAEEQSAASEEINRAIEQVNAISEETSRTMNHSAQAVAELASQSHVLMTLMKKLETEGKGEGGTKALR